MLRGAELASPPPVGLRGAATAVARYTSVEFELDLPTAYDHPFDPDEVEADLEIAPPAGPSFRVPAFWFQPYEHRRLEGGDKPRDWFYLTGPARWQARVAPLQLGPHRVVARVRDRAGERTSAEVRFDCVPSARHGFLRVSRTDPRFLEFSDGHPFFALGQNLAFIGNQQYVTVSRATDDLFPRLATNGANYLRLWTGCGDWALAIEDRKSAWGRSWNWRPSFVPRPDAPERRCVLVPTNQPVLNVQPSHDVALRPDTRYRFAARVRTAPATRLVLELHRTRPPSPFASPHEDAWIECRHEFTTGPHDLWLAGLSFRREGPGPAWVADLSLREADGGPELLWEADPDRPARGAYNPVDCAMLDVLVRAAETHGLHLQLCLLARDLYMDALKDPASPAYARAIRDAQRTFRYAVARWGASTSVGAWEYWNEMNPGLPTDRFYTELGAYLDRIDPYHHLRTTSTWGPSPKDARHPQLDLADVHFYLRPADRGRLRDEVDAVLERARWLREQAPAKPAVLGEFGLADDQWRITAQLRQSPSLADAHNALWASALSGLSGSAWAWWWERLDERDVYPLYRPVSRFLANVPWNGGDVRGLRATASDPDVRVIGLQAGPRAWFWVFSPDAAWHRRLPAGATPARRTGLTVTLPGLPHSSSDARRVQWWDTHSGAIVTETPLPPGEGDLRLTVPPFAGDIAAQIGPSDTGSR